MVRKKPGNPSKAALPKLTAFDAAARELQQAIRSIAEDTVRVFFLPHAQERMAERGIDAADVYRVLRSGFVDEASLEPGENAGEQVCKVVEHNKGARDLGVVTIVIRERKLLVKTVEWEDFR